jgi:large subunit ribosomal protein L18
MTQQDLKWIRRERRAQSARKGLRAQPGRPRLSVFRSVKHISAQIIDDVAGRTLVSASTYEKDLAPASAKGTKCSRSRAVGESIAKRAIEKGIDKVVFDRGPFRYHGRVKALADGARAGGLKF